MRELRGVNEAILPVPSRLTTPMTGVTPGPATVNVVTLMVAGFMASSNVAVTRSRDICLQSHPAGRRKSPSEEAAHSRRGGGKRPYKIAGQCIARHILGTGGNGGGKGCIQDERASRGKDKNLVGHVVSDRSCDRGYAGPASLKDAELMLAGSMACGKVTAITVLEHIPVDSLAGLTELGGRGG